MTSATFMTLFSLSALVGGLVTYFHLKRQRHQRFIALVALEISLPVEMPTECPKCGHSGTTRKPTGEFYNGPPTFHGPIHQKRLAAIDRPEHLAHRCWQCGFEVKTAAKAH